VLTLSLLCTRSLDAVEDLLANPNFGALFDSMAKKLPDIERMLSRIHAKSCKKQELCVYSFAAFAFDSSVVLTLHVLTCVRPASKSSP
jgi:hypothetical protein